MSATFVTMHANPGEDIKQAGRRAITVAEAAKVVVKLVHNDRTATVERGTTLASVVAQFDRQDRTRDYEYLHGVVASVIADVDTLCNDASGSGNRIDGFPVVKVPEVRAAISWLSLAIEES